MNKAKRLPPAEILRTLMIYDAISGRLEWRERSRDLFSSDRSHRLWNARYAGTPALNRINSHGYRAGKILGESFLAHRVAWKMTTGEDADVADHVNGDKSDNRMVNLRSITFSENAKNRPTPRNNTSGRVGVHLCNKNKKWVAQIGIPGVGQRQVGHFDNMEDAISARSAAEIKYGYHQNHGRLAA